MSVTDSDVSSSSRVRGLYYVARYRPAYTLGIIGLSIFAAVLEGIGLSYLIPVVEIAQQTSGANEVGESAQLFLSAYQFVGIPFTLETVVLGVIGVMVTRFTASFLVAWLRAALRTRYIRHLQTEGYKHALDARIGYYDDHGSEEILNAIVTQSEYASRTISQTVRIVEQAFLCVMYLAIALYISLWLAVLSGILLGGILFLFRNKLESGYAIGNRVAEANEKIQEVVQKGSQGIREVKIFGLRDELLADFQSAVNQFTRSNIQLLRNKALLDNVYQMMAAVTVFGLIYVGIRFSSLSFASLGVFLFALFRLAPRVSTLNNMVYNLEGNLPHLVRTQQFISELQEERERNAGQLAPPSPATPVAFRDVTFTYGDEIILDELSFEVGMGEFTAFVGQSGAGKSTIVSLLTRMYNPNQGRITASNEPIEDFDLQEWRDKISVVQQDPHIFNDTLRYNIKVANRSATAAEVEEVCDLALVSEFSEDLPQGLDSVLGDDGVRLSGGQRQRVALARALLKDADILVLDEATSNLDSQIEEKVHRRIEEQDADSAVIVIAHRLSTVVSADRIHVMDNGCISESGTHQELLAEAGAYADLYRTQTQN